MEDLNKYEKELTEEYRVDFSGTGYCLVTGCFKHSDEPSAPIKWSEILNQLSGH